MTEIKTQAVEICSHLYPATSHIFAIYISDLNTDWQQQPPYYCVIPIKDVTGCHMVIAGSNSLLFFVITKIKQKSVRVQLPRILDELIQMWIWNYATEQNITTMV